MNMYFDKNDSYSLCVTFVSKETEVTPTQQLEEEDSSSLCVPFLSKRSQKRADFLYFFFF